MTSRVFATVARYGLAVALCSLPALVLAQSLAKESLPGMDDYTRIDAGDAGGGALSLDAIPELKRRGFVAVINFRLPQERDANVDAESKAVQAAGLKYIYLPYTYTSTDGADVVGAFLKAIADPANHPVYMHSRTAHRVGAMWLIKRVVLDGWTVEKASAEAEIIGMRDESRRFALDYLKAHPR